MKQYGFHKDSFSGVSQGKSYYAVTFKIIFLKLS